MQIHEITKPNLAEGAFSNIAKGFVQGITGVDFPRQQGTNPAALAKATRKRARELAQQWSQQIKTQKKSQTVASTQSKTAGTAVTQLGAPAARSPEEIADMKARGFDPATGQRITPGTTPAASPTTTATTSTAAPTVKPKYGTVATGPITLGGKRLDPKNPNDAKVLAAMRAQGKLQEATDEYTTSGGIVVPGGTKTDLKSAGTVDFESWADQQLTTQVSGTKQPIDLDAVKKDPAVKAELDKVLPQIKKDPTNLAAVEMYFLTAMKGMQRMAAQARQNAGLGSKASDADPLSKIVNAQQLQALKNLAQNPQMATALKKTLGLA